MADNGDFLAGLVIGGLLGFVAGVLLAPASGSETREMIADRTQSAVKQARSGMAEVGGLVKENMEKVVDVVKDVLPETCCKTKTETTEGNEIQTDTEGEIQIQTNTEEAGLA